MSTSPSPWMLIKRGVTFVLGLSILLAAVEGLLRADREGNCYVAKSHALERVRDHVEILFLGSSHAEHAVDPSVVSLGGFNIAHPSETVPYSCAVARYWIPRLPRLKTIVLSISYFSLQMTTEAPETWRAPFYSYYYPDNGETVLTIDEWLSRHSLTYVYGFGHLRVPLQSAIRAALHLPAPQNYSSYGADVRLAPPTQRQDIARSASAHASLQRGYMKEQNEAAVLAKLRDFARTLEKRHISLVLVTTPVTPEYEELMAGRSWRRQVAALRQLCRATGATYVDYSRDSRFAYEDFVDADHLRHSGAVKFTRLLAARL